MSYGTLPDIITKIRKLTGSGNDFQLTDPMIQDFIDSFYLFDFPAQFRSLKLKDKYVFRTIQGQDTYSFDSERYTTVQMPCHVEKTPVQLYQTPDVFWANWGFNNGAGSQFEDNFDFGNATTGPYGGTLTAAPLIKSVNTNPILNPNHISIVQNLLITANTATGTLNVYDDGLGNLIGDVLNGPVPVVPGSSGTINYQTGVITGLLFSASIPAGNQIQCQYIPVVLNTPTAILFFQNQFTLRPVPDMGYTVELTCYRRPSQVLATRNGTTGDYPELTEWWETIAYGAAKKIYEERLDPDGIALMDKGLKERYSLNETRTYAQLGKQRAGTIFSPQLDNGAIGGSGYGQGGGF